MLSTNRDASAFGDGRPRRLFRIVRMLRARPWGLHELEAELQVSAPQLRRDLTLLREVLAEDGLILHEEGTGRRQKQVWLESVHMTNTTGVNSMETTLDPFRVTDADVIQRSAQQAYEEQWYGLDRGLVNGLGDTIIAFDSVPTARRAQQHEELIACCAEQGIKLIAKGRYQITRTMGFRPGPEGRLRSAQALKKYWDEIVQRDLALPRT